jgi:hypothetical protein
MIISRFEWDRDTKRSMKMETLTYGNTSISFDGLPAQSQRALASRGLTHFLGSEQASKVGPNSSWAAKFEKDNGRKPTDAEVEAQKAANLANAIIALNDGTIGTARGPKLDPIEAEIERMATNEVWDKLSGAKLCKKNKRPDDDDIFEFANGDKFTFAVLVERAIARGGDKMRNDATKKVEFERKAKEKRKAEAEKVAAAGPVDAATLGL